MIGRTRTVESRVLFWVIIVGLLSLTPSLWLHGDPSRSSDLTSGRWVLDFEPDGSIQLTLKRRADGHGNWSSSDDYLTKDFRGLQRPAGSAEVPARFEMVRDAGTITFEGQLNESGGSGRFSFAANGEYVAALAKMGYRSPAGDDLFSLTVHDVSRAFIQELEKLGYKHLPLDNLMSMRIHGASPEFIRSLQALGYEHVPADDLVSMRIHGCHPRIHPGAQVARLRQALDRRPGLDADPRSLARVHPRAQVAGLRPALGG